MGVRSAYAKYHATTAGKLSLTIMLTMIVATWVSIVGLLIGLISREWYGIYGWMPAAIAIVALVADTIGYALHRKVSRGARG